jgi:hypothetical protein
MRHRCAGSGQVPTATTVLWPRRSVRIDLGACPMCGAWIGVRTNGTVRAHVNWAERVRAPEKAPRRVTP